MKTSCTQITHIKPASIHIERGFVEGVVENVLTVYGGIPFAVLPRIQ
jgi:hypothetical protein